MRRWLPFLCVFASVAGAQDYEGLLAEARAMLTDEPGSVAERFDAQFDRLGQIALAHPDRWEAYYERGENRCKRAFFHRAEVDMYLARARAAGMEDKALQGVREEAEAQIERWRVDAHREFSIAENIMMRQGRPDRERLLFANASMKFAGREYLEARHGERGAIEDFKELVRLKFLPDVCADHIALCYLDVGHDAYLHRRYQDAQRAWDEGISWAHQPRLRQVLWTNKAGAFEMDHQYQLAEGVLKQQIAADPSDPAHHKNLGLVLGYENRLKEALYHYEKARELCGGLTDTRALFNGNAWLRAAVIHGTLLEREGDVLLAWRLFLEYRQLFGDDYNFCLWFGDFASANGAYNLAWLYIEHARDLQPRCAPAYMKLTQIAPRTEGTREEIDVRMKAAAQALYDAQARYYVADESPTVLKICGGIADLGDLGVGVQKAGFIDPDPLKGFDASHPPPWVVEAAKTRDPFVPFDPAAAPNPEPSAPTPHPERKGPWPLVVGAVVLLGAVVLVLFLRRPKP